MVTGPEQLGDVLAVAGEADAVDDALRALANAYRVPGIGLAVVPGHGRDRSVDRAPAREQ